MGIKEKLVRVAKRSIVLPTIYFGALVTSEGLAPILSEQIKDQTQLEKICVEEIFKLDTNNQRKIIPKLSKESKAISRKIGENEYEIEVGILGATRHSVRHELYHIYGGHCDELYSLWIKKESTKKGLKYWFNQEPSSELYATFGIKI